MTEEIIVLVLKIIFAVIGIIATYAGARAGQAYKKHIDTEEKKFIVRTGVQAVEQLYSGLKGEEKFLMACQHIEEMLSERGIKISANDLQMLIESAVANFNNAFADECDKPDSTPSYTIQ